MSVFNLWINEILPLCSLGLYQDSLFRNIRGYLKRNRNTEPVTNTGHYQPFKIKKGLKVRHWTIEILENPFRAIFAERFPSIRAAVVRAATWRADPGLPHQPRPPRPRPRQIHPYFSSGCTGFRARQALILQGRWVAKSVAGPAGYGSSLGRIQTSLICKYKRAT